MWRCSQCGGENDGGTYCIYCGSKRSSLLKPGDAGQKASYPPRKEPSKDGRAVPNASRKDTRKKRNPRALPIAAVILFLSLFCFAGVMVFRNLRQKDLPLQTQSLPHEESATVSAESSPVVETPTPLTPDRSDARKDAASEQVEVSAPPVQTVSADPQPAPTPVTSAPTANAGSSSAPAPAPVQEVSAAQRGREDIKGCDNRIIVPEDDNWLEEYETKYVKSSIGTCIILRWRPEKDFEYDGYNFLGRVWEKETVTEMARQNGYSLIKTSAGQVGWVPSQYIVSVY